MVKAKIIKATVGEPQLKCAAITVYEVFHPNDENMWVLYIDQDPAETIGEAQKRADYVPGSVIVRTDLPAIGGE